MMKLAFYFISLVLVYPKTLAQHHYDYNWILGKDYDLTMDGREGVLIKFNGDSVQIEEYDLAFEMYIQNTTISDSLGNLRYYSNGCQVADHNDSIVVDDLNKGEFRSVACGSNLDRGYIGRQKIHNLIIGTNYYMLHESLVRTNDSDIPIILDNFFLTKLVEDSIMSNHIIKNRGLSSGRSTSTKIRNRDGWWTVKHDFKTDSVYIYKITQDTIKVKKYSTGHNFIFDGGGGSAKFNSSGDIFASYSPFDGLALFSFDRSLGEIKFIEYIDIPYDQSLTAIGGFIEFSPSGQYLYIADRLNIYQLDVWADDIEASLTLVAEHDGFVGNNIGQQTTFSDMELGPDCRIWMMTGPSLPYMHVIMYPDRKGTACDVQQHAIKLPYPHFRGLPHYPNYRLDTSEPRCDSSKVLVLNGVTTPIKEINEDLGQAVNIFPSPASEYVTIEPYQDLGVIQIYSSDGQLVFESDEVLRGTTISIADWAKGMYLIRLQYKDGSRGVEKFVKW